MYRTNFVFVLSVLTTLFSIVSCTKINGPDTAPENVKVALRYAAHKILLSNKDTTSIVPPIKQINENRYEMVFKNSLTLNPDSLVAIVNHSLNSARGPRNYIVEVINCSDKEVAYSFQIAGTKEKELIPCLGRNLPEGCYTIQVLFSTTKPSAAPIFGYLLIAVLLVLFISIWFLYKRKLERTSLTSVTSPYTKIGAYKFYKNENKLIKDALEIKLSIKECELMSLFSNHQNQVIRREIIIKQIWEDHGVYVDRSLDTFVSKLRKKFKNDPTIRFENIHGVGYKLVVN